MQKENEELLTQTVKEFETDEEFNEDEVEELDEDEMVSDEEVEELEKVLPKTFNGLTNYFKRVAEYSVPSREEEIRIFQALENAKTEAEKKVLIDEIVTRNLRLCISFAKKYAAYSMSFEDCIQNANIGLMTAVEKYDYKKGFKFSTYASWWIRQSIMRENANNGRRSVRLPVHLVDRIQKIKKAREELADQLGRIPNNEELSHFLTDMTPQQINEADIYAQDNLSFDYTIGTSDKSDDQMTLLDIVEDTRHTSTEEYVSNNEMKEAINMVFSILNEKEKTVLILRFGLNDGQQHTLEEAGEMLGVTRERIRQIQKNALRKIKIKYGDNLLEYLPR